MIIQAPAFPVSFRNSSGESINDPFGEPILPNQTATYTGLTYFEYAAIAAMQGMLASDSAPTDPGFVAKFAVQHAEALMMELGHVKE